MQIKPEYEFIPYKYGCFSYSANADLITMVNKDQLLETSSSIIKNEKTTYLRLLKADDQIKLRNIFTTYGKMNSDALMKHTYKNFPFWAINSVIAQSILSTEEYETVQKQKNKSNETILYTIGYEGSSLEGYLNRLIKNGVKVLIDVRNNPLSMKFGFSKTLLKRYCESIGISYMHFPEVGIQSDKRQTLITQADYDKLFIQYRSDNLSKTKDSQTNILSILTTHKKVALTCFEADICQCHRKHLAEAIAELPDFDYELKHI